MQQQKISFFPRYARWMLIAATAITAPAYAQPTAANASGAGSGSNVAWSGSFSRSCSNIDVDKHGRLSATCARKDGKKNRTHLAEKDCPGHRAANDDGKLVCETSPASGGSAGGGTVGQNRGDSGRWEGSFKQSCRDFSVNEDGTLSATCQTRSGAWRDTSLARVNCTSNRADNDDGHLVCESQRVGMNRWEGSFERTCRDIYMDEKGTLTATCPTSNGEWNRSWLSAEHCSGYRAANKEGRLVCEQGGRTAGNDRKDWDGSFKRSCRDISVDDRGTLTASCQARNGTWQRATLAAVNCTDRRAKNDDGRLACESQRAGVNRWDGSFAQTCRDVYMDASGTLTATCQSRSGEWIPARLTANACGSYRAANDNGRLVCETQTSVRR